MTHWYDVTDDAARERLLAAWPDAPTANLETCAMLLDTAREQVIAYARDADVLDPDGELLTDLPSRIVYAQLQQAKNLWNAGRVASDGDYGADGYTFTPRPLDKTIKQIIRPVDGRPHVL